MKKLALLFIAMTLVFSACEKDEESKSYEKSDLLGLWEQTDPVAEDASCDSYGVFLEFTNDELKSITDCSGAESSITLEYTFDGKKISYEFFFTINMTIVELTDTKLVVDESIVGIDGSERVTYTRAD